MENSNQLWVGIWKKRTIITDYIFLNTSVAVTEHYSTLSGLIQLVISLECFIGIAPDFLCPFMNESLVIAV